MPLSRHLRRLLNQDTGGGGGAAPAEELPAFPTLEDIIGPGPRRQQSVRQMHKLVILEDCSA